MNMNVEKLRFLKMWYLKLVVQNKKKDKKQLCFKNSGTQGLVKEKLYPPVKECVKFWLIGFGSL